MLGDSLGGFRHELQDGYHLIPIYGLFPLMFLLNKRVIGEGGSHQPPPHSPDTDTQ